MEAIRRKYIILGGGMVAGYAAKELAERGDVASTSFSVWWLKEGRVVAAFAMNRPDEEREAAPELIQSKRRVTAEEIQAGAAFTG